jgi:hypothetical protein
MIDQCYFHISRLSRWGDLSRHKRCTANLSTRKLLMCFWLSSTMDASNLISQTNLSKPVFNTDGSNWSRSEITSSVSSPHHSTQSEGIPSLFVYHVLMQIGRYVEYQYSKSTIRLFPYEKYQTVRDLCLAVLRRFSRPILSQARAGRRLGLSGQMRPPETAFRDEFYRAYGDAVGLVGDVWSEWAGTRQGRIDFLIIEPGWGIELLLDGDHLTNQCRLRFHENGAYYRWTTRGLVRDWIILECRHSYPQATCGTLFPNYRMCLWLTHN